VDEESKNVKNAQATVRDIDSKLKSLNKYSASRFYWGTFLDAVQQIAAENVRLVEIRGEHNYRTNQTAKLLTTNLVVSYTAAPPGWKFWASAQASAPIHNLVSNHFNTITNRLPFTTNEVPYTTKITPDSTNETEGLITAKVEFTMVPSGSEQITVEIRGRDYGNPPGAAIDEFARRLTSASFFKEWLVRGEGIRFTERPPQPRPDPSDLLNPNALFVPFTIECSLKERVFTNE
jgi:hypothetical protein